MLRESIHKKDISAAIETWTNTERQSYSSEIITNIIKQMIIIFKVENMCFFPHMYAISVQQMAAQSNNVELKRLHSKRL